MSEWFKEHDWKSCDGGDSSGGSNPLLCATERRALSPLFFVAQRRGRKKIRIIGEFARDTRRGNIWRIRRVIPCIDAFEAEPKKILFSAPKKAPGRVFFLWDKIEIQTLCKASVDIFRENCA